jgi:DNA-binding beta-propeller fold protein YncE
MSVINGATNTVTTNVAAFSLPQGVDVDPLTHAIYVANFNGNSVSVVTLQPTTKAECQKGGWRDFSEFKNQGDCIQFVTGK